MGDQSKKIQKEMRREVKNAEVKALEMLCNLFDWLDSLEPQPTTEIVALYEKSHVIESKITDTLTQMGQASDLMAKINKMVEESQKKSSVSASPHLHLVCDSYARWTKDMDGFSKFEKIINAQVWKQQPAPTLNYLCITPDCYSTCGVKHSFASIFLLWPRQFSSCSQCNHPHLSHFHLRSTWQQMHDAPLSVDEDTRTQWEAAKDEKARAEALLVTSKNALEDLSRIIDEAMDELARLAEEYGRLSLSGSFSAPLEKVISLLEQWCKGMEEKGVPSELLTKVRTTLDNMKMRLDLLRQANEKVRKEVRKIEGRVQSKVRKVEEKVQASVRKGKKKVNKTIRTIEGGLQEEGFSFLGTIKKVKAGLWK